MKQLAIPLAIIFGLAFLPFVIGLLLAQQEIQTERLIQQPTQIIEPSPTPTLSQPSPSPASTNLISVKVVRVIDGDTIEVDIGGGNNKRVRYIGIDTPELGRLPECYAREAYEQNRKLVDGKTVQIDKDVSETDRHARLLRYVYVNSIFVNLELVRLGYAHASSYPPDIKHQDKLRQAEQQARSANKGLWGSCGTPTPTGANTGGFVCDCSKTCAQITSCEEAQFQLNSCGCSQRDADKDGIACDGAPLRCQ
jgi:endonuclease YncB( thermonuclease family)